MRGDLLPLDQIHLGQPAYLVPSGPDVSPSPGRAPWPEAGQAVTVTESIFAAARRGAVHLYKLEEVADASAP